MKSAQMKPHWGKTHHCGAATLERLYGAEKLEAFRALASQHDTEGKFRESNSLRIRLEHQ